MRYIFSEKFDQESFALHLKQMENDPEVSTILVNSTFNNSIESNDFFEICKKCTKNYLGAFFPGIIYQSFVYETGYLLIGFDSKFNLKHHIIKNLSDKRINELEQDIKELHFTPDIIKTVLIIEDAFSKGIKNLIDAFFNIYSLNYNFIGGGAGSADFISKPCIFDNKGFYQDSALIITSNLETAIGVNHGFIPIDGPYLVTKSRGCIIDEIEYEPALEFYKKIISKYHPQSIDDKNFSDISKSYPLGIPKLQSEAIIRNAARIINKTFIEFFGTVPDNTSVFLMNGSKESFVKGIIQASINADAPDTDNFAYVLDCFSRAHALGDHYSKILNLIRLREEMIIGALTIGEIASPKRDYLELLNQTCVITRFFHDK